MLILGKIYDRVGFSFMFYIIPGILFNQYAYDLFYRDLEHDFTMLNYFRGLQLQLCLFDTLLIVTAFYLLPRPWSALNYNLVPRGENVSFYERRDF